MRALVVADVHANLDALDAVLRDAEAQGGFEAVWCLGDTVGYGAEPEACIDRLHSYPLEAIAGNHDLAAIGAITFADFNPYAAAAARWTSQRLSDEHKTWLAGLQQVSTVSDEFTLAHGSLNDPIWEYLVYPETAVAHLKHQETVYGFVGHSHLPLVFFEGGSQASAVDKLPLNGTRFVANPGSVGQPRDGDPRAGYAIVDTTAREVVFYRVEYDVASAQRKIRAAGLPDWLAARLAEGR
jgi:diadenosine tetraphosphatase ApaH/serine/threonine PP2A family protein phosphatase